MDQGVRIVWYDLPDNSEEKYLDWLHGTYLPHVLARQGVSWAAHYRIIKTDKEVQRLSKFVGRPDDAEDVPTGSQFALLIGAGSPHLFFKPNFDDVDRADAATRAMFDTRIGVRTVVAIEQARVDGPEMDARAPATTPGPFIQLGHFCVRSVEEEFDICAWYADYRLPTIARMPGAIAARKLVTVAGWAKHVVLYEFLSAQAHHDNFMAGHESLAFTEGEWTNRVVKYTAHAPGSPSIGERIWPAVG